MFRLDLVSHTTISLYSVEVYSKMFFWMMPVLGSLALLDILKPIETFIALVGRASSNVVVIAI